MQSAKLGRQGAARTRQCAAGLKQFSHIRLRRRILLSSSTKLQNCPGAALQDMMQNDSGKSTPSMLLGDFHDTP
jgi:hypothetical protein